MPEKLDDLVTKAKAKIAEAIRLAVAAEREACAAKAETHYAGSHCHPGTNLIVQGLDDHRAAGKAIAAAIRARKE